MIYKAMQSIYIIEKEGKAIKIGFSQESEKYIRKILGRGDFEVTNSYYTEPCSNAHEIKFELQSKYKEKKIKGEWFAVPFNESVELLKTIFEQRASLTPKQVKVITLEEIEEAYARKNDEYSK